jgi:hypothetical protein
VFASFCGQFQLQAGSARRDNLKTALAEQHPTMRVCVTGLGDVPQFSGQLNTRRSVNPARNCSTPLRKRNLKTRHGDKSNAPAREHAISHRGRVPEGCVAPLSALGRTCVTRCRAWRCTRGLAGLHSFTTPLSVKFANAKTYSFHVAAPCDYMQV